MSVCPGALMVNEAITGWPPSITTVSGDGNSNDPALPASICSSAKRLAVANVGSIAITTFLLVPLLTWLKPTIPPITPFMLLWMTAHPGPLLVTVATVMVLLARF